MITRLIKPHLSSLKLSLCLWVKWYQTMISTADAVSITPENGHWCWTAEGYKLSKWSTPEMMTCSSWLSWPFSWSTHFVSLYLSPLNLKINCYYLLPFLFAAGDCYMLNSWWQLMRTYIWTGGTLLTLPGSAEAAGRDSPVTTPKCFKDSDCETKPPCPARRCPCLYC